MKRPPASALPVYWTCATFERDWLERLFFRHIPCRVEMDGEFRRSGGDAVVVHSCQDRKTIDRYVAGFRNVVVINLGDEWNSFPKEHYAMCRAVFRTYWFHGNKARVFPLGLGRGFSASPSIPASSRSHFWCFMGQTFGKPTRQSMIERMEKYSGCVIYLTHSWLDPNQMRGRAYASILENSVFAAAPGGWATAPETFRLYEGLEAGAIPVVPDADLRYYRSLYGEVPFVPDSTDLRTVDLDSTQRACRSWWAREEPRHSNEFVLTLRKAGMIP